MFLKRCFESEKENQDPHSDVHWFEKRKDIAAKALRLWRQETDEMSELKKDLNEEAKALNKQINLEKNMARQRSQQIQSQLQRDQQQIEQRQQVLLDAVLNSNTLCGKASSSAIEHVPASHCPLALASFAKKHELLPISDAKAVDKEDAVVSVGPTPEIDLALSHPGVNEELVDSITEAKTGVHGLGDRKFPISEFVVDSACKEVGFLEHSSKQFRSEHGSICENVAPLDIDENNKLDCPTHCQRELGRFCKNDIINHERFVNSIGMVKSITRVLASRRTAKCGNQYYFAPDVPFPVLLLSSDNVKYGRLASRVTFNPLEIDFIQCSVKSELDGCFLLTMLFDSIPGHSLMLPRTDTTSEFAIWFSHLDDNSTCQVFWNYDLVHDGTGHIRIRLHTHASNLASCIGEGSFSDLIPKKENPKGKLSDEEAQSLASAKKLLSDIGLGASSGKRTKPGSSGEKNRNTNKKTKSSSNGKSSRVAIADAYNPQDHDLDHQNDDELPDKSILMKNV